MSVAQLHLSLKSARKEIAQLKVANAGLEEYKSEAEALRRQVSELSERAEEAEQHVGALQHSNHELAAEARRATREKAANEKRLLAALRQQKVDTKLVKAYKKRVEEHKQSALEAAARRDEEATARGKAEALNEQLKEALARAGSQRLVDMHAHAEALKGARAEAARVAALPVELKRARAAEAQAHSARMQAEETARLERSLAEAAQGELEAARAALEAERETVKQLRTALKDARAEVKRLENDRYRQGAAADAMRRGGRGGTKAAPPRRGRGGGEPGDHPQGAPPAPGLGLSAALPSLEARSALRSTVASRIRSKGRTPAQILREAQGLLRGTTERVARAEAELKELKEDAEAAGRDLEAYTAQREDMEMRRTRARHAKEAVDGLRSGILKEIYSRRRLHQLLANMRQQRLDHMRSLPPDPYRVPPEIVKGGLISYHRAVAMVQARAKAWITRRALAREAMAEERRQQARADELGAELKQHSDKQREFDGLHAAASQRVEETTARIRTMSQRIADLESQLREERARMERERGAVAEAEAEVAWAARQEAEVEAIHDEATRAPVRSSLRLSPPRAPQAPYRRPPDSAPASGLRSFAARHRGHVSRSGSVEAFVENAATRHAVDDAFNALFSQDGAKKPEGVACSTSSQALAPPRELDPNPWRKPSEPTMRRSLTAAGALSRQRRSTGGKSAQTAQARPVQSAGGVPAAASEKGSLFLGSGLGIRRSQAMGGVRQGGSAKEVLRQILAEREEAAERARKAEAKRRMEAELGLGPASTGRA